MSDHWDLIWYANLGGSGNETSLRAIRADGRLTDSVSDGILTKTRMNASGAPAIKWKALSRLNLDAVIVGEQEDA